MQASVKWKEQIDDGISRIVQISFLLQSTLGCTEMSHDIQLPDEILDTICSLIARPHHLLNLASTCKHWHRIIIPHHLEYRYIRCDFERVAVWTHLVDKPTLSARITTLEIIEEGENFNAEPVIPSSVYPDLVDYQRERGSGAIPSDAAVDSFLDALEIIGAGLVAVRWFTYYPFNELHSFIHHYCQNLTEVEILAGGRDEHSRYLHVDAISGFSNLTRFSFSDRALEAFDLSALEAMLYNCPHLEDLQLDKELSPNTALWLPEIFTIGRWPMLKRLTVQPAIILHDHHAFFQDHPSIRCLSLTGFDLWLRGLYANPPNPSVGDFRIDFSGLDNLRSLSLSFFVSIGPGMPIPPHVARGLVSLSLNLITHGRSPRDKYSPWVHHDSTSVSSLSNIQMFRECVNLRDLTIYSEFTTIRDPVESLLECVPDTIERLVYVPPSNIDSFEQHGTTDSFAPITRLANLPRSFNNLTHLGYVHVPHVEASYDFDEDELRQKNLGNISIMVGLLGGAAPKLRYLALIGNTTSDRSWKEIQRAQVELSEEIDEPTMILWKNHPNIDFSNWGGHYLGASEQGELDW